MTAKKIVFFMLIAIVVPVLYFFYARVDYKIPKQIKNSNKKQYRNINFNKEKNDVFSFIHIQKTGGTTMEKHLVFNIKDSGCECRQSKRPACNCYRKEFREVWLICRYNIPKWPCGLHPDYITLRECAPGFMDKTYGQRERRFLYGTLLRDPIYRFLSEFRHRQRGATWDTAAAYCNGQLLSDLNPSCHEGTQWEDLTLDQFLSCSSNFGINRQTWMLSNLSSVGCNFEKIKFKKEKRELLLKIAKENLASLAYFGLIEYPKESQYIFERTFNLKFKVPFQLWDTGFATEYLKGPEITEESIKRMAEANDLDQRLYRFAKKIFFQRYNYFVRKYGPPKYYKPLNKTRFDFPNAKLQRIKDNLPKSLHKEQKKIIKRAKQAIKEVWNS